MGKNGDQIQRLFKTPASVFIVQYWGQVSESVIEQMSEFAKAKSAVEGSIIYYGIIDGDDSNRLLKAYPKAFQRERKNTGQDKQFCLPNQQTQTRKKSRVD
jgi:hypothetical protein